MNTIKNLMKQLRVFCLLAITVAIFGCGGGGGGSTTQPVEPVDPDPVISVSDFLLTAEMTPFASCVVTPVVSNQLNIAVASAIYAMVPDMVDVCSADKLLANTTLLRTDAFVYNEEAAAFQLQPSTVQTSGYFVSEAVYLPTFILNESETMSYATSAKLLLTLTEASSGYTVDVTLNLRSSVTPTTSAAMLDKRAGWSANDMDPGTTDSETQVLGQDLPLVMIAIEQHILYNEGEDGKFMNYFFNPDGDDVYQQMVISAGVLNNYALVSGESYTTTKEVSVEVGEQTYTASAVAVWSYWDDGNNTPYIEVTRAYFLFYGDGGITTTDVYIDLFD